MIFENDFLKGVQRKACECVTLNNNPKTITRNLAFGTPGRLIFRKAKNRW